MDCNFKVYLHTAMKLSILVNHCDPNQLAREGNCIKHFCLNYAPFSNKNSVSKFLYYLEYLQSP